MGQIGRLKYQIIGHIRLQLWPYIICLFFLLTGLFAGIVMAQQLPMQNALTLYSDLGLGKGQVFKQTLIQMRDFALFFACGLHPSGLLPGVVLAGYRGFVMGFYLSMVYFLSGILAACACAITLVPYGLITLHAFITIMGQSGFSKRPIAHFALYTLTLLALSLVFILTCAWFV